MAAAGKRDYDFLFKLVLIGDSGVGKSCLLLRFSVSARPAAWRPHAFGPLIALLPHGTRGSRDRAASCRSLPSPQDDSFVDSFISTIGVDFVRRRKRVRCRRLGPSARAGQGMPPRSHHPQGSCVEPH